MAVMDKVNGWNDKGLAMSGDELEDNEGGQLAACLSLKVLVEGTWKFS